jgi:hypothetical protein
MKSGGQQTKSVSNQVSCYKEYVAVTTTTRFSVVLLACAACCLSLP